MKKFNVIWIVLSIMLVSMFLEKPLFSAKFLHLSFHRGCIRDIEFVMKKLGHEVTSCMIQDLPEASFDGMTTGNELYNITHERAQNIWTLHKQYFDTFDAIVTSDTAPLSRIFLQNGWKKPLIIWVCNRFDYHHGTSTNFPDSEYYKLFKAATRQQNVRIIAYNAFETFYAKKKGIDIGSLLIKPCASLPEGQRGSAIPSEITKESTFFLPPYHNEESYDTARQCKELGIPAYHGRYNGPADLAKFKGIIHLPYAWSNLAFFENMQNGIPYFLPSKSFIKKLERQKSKMGYFHTEAHCIFNQGQFELSEWYCSDYRDIIVYFDSWADLAKKIKTADYEHIRSRIRQKAVEHQITMLTRWQQLIDSLFFE